MPVRASAAAPRAAWASSVSISECTAAAGSTCVAGAGSSPGVVGGIHSRSSSKSSGGGAVSLSMGAGSVRRLTRHTSAWQSSTSTVSSWVLAMDSRASRLSPRARAWSTTLTSAGHQVLACIAVARCAPMASVRRSAQAGVRARAVSTPWATAGARWRLIRHHSADAAWSSGRGAPMAVSRRARASIPVRAIAASRSASCGVKVSCRTAGATVCRVWVHSARAGLWVLPSRCCRLRCHRAWALASCLGPVGRWSLSGTVFAARHTARSASRSGPGRAWLLRHQGGVPWRVPACLAHLGGQLGDEVGSAGQVRAPLRVVPQRVGDGGQPGQRPGAGVAQAGVVQAPAQDRGAVGGGVQLVDGSRRPAAAVTGSVPVAASRTRCARRVGQAGSSAIPGTTRSAPLSSAAMAAGPRWCSAARWRASR